MDVRKFLAILGPDPPLSKPPQMFEKNRRVDLGDVRCTRRGLTKKIYTFSYIFRKAPSRTWRVREGALRARKKYILFHIFFVRPLLEHGVYEKVPCAHACARLSRLSFRALLTSG